MKKTICILLLTALLLGLMAVPAFGDNVLASATKDKPPQRSIAIVFDNSGSMFIENGKGDKAWCQAIYAMEVFASMMNEDDTILIYPMWEIDTDAGTFDMDHPLRISSPSEAKVIRTIHTSIPLNTPIEAVDRAYEGLQDLDGEKWLIVLTDGDSFWMDGEDQGRGQPTVSLLNERLGGYNRNVNVLYLGIGAQSAMPGLSKTGDYTYKEDKAADSAQVLQKLTQMCNMIFGRDALPNPGSQLKLPLSMSRVFVFIQGPNISNVTISGGGQSFESSQNLFPHFGERGCGELGADGKGSGQFVWEGKSYNYPFLTDDSLQGVISTYNDIPKSDTPYSLDYDGNATSIEIYYEPNVDIKPVLINPEGKEVESKEDLIPGEYTLKYGLLDGVTKEPVDMSLLGDNISYVLSYILNGETVTVTGAGAGGEETFTLAAGDTMELEYITAEFLKDYHLTKHGSDFDFPWGGPIDIHNNPPGTLTLQLSGGQDNYHLSKLTEEESFEARLTYNDEPLIGEELEKVKLTPDFGGRNLGCTLQVENDHVRIGLTYPDPAHPENTDDGGFTMTVKAAYAPEKTEPSEAEGTASFFIENDVTGLSAELILPKSGGYTRSELTDSTFYVNLRMGGNPLTEAEMNALNHIVTLDGEGTTIPVEVEKDAANSRLILRANGDGAATGDYLLSVQASTKNQLGQDARATAEAELSVRLMPAWLELVLWVLGLILLGLLIWYIMSRKILPKRINVANTNFMVDGEEVRGEASANYHDGGKRFGRISINSPTSPTNPLAKCSINMNLEASDTRWKVLRCRLKRNNSSLTVMRIKLNSSLGVNTVRMAGVTSLWDENHKPILSPASPEENPRVLLGNDGRITVLAEVMDDSGGTVDVSLSCNLHFQ